MAGGTGFYLRWFVLGKPNTPPSSAASEARAAQRLEQVGRQPGRQAGMCRTVFCFRLAGAGGGAGGRSEVGSLVGE